MLIIDSTFGNLDLSFMIISYWVCEYGNVEFNVPAEGKFATNFIHRPVDVEQQVIKRLVIGVLKTSSWLGTNSS